jgi:hypothetical protein
VTQQYDVTSVGINPAQDRARRMRMYFLAMSLRMACVLSLFWVRGWWVLLAGLGAVVLPYFAVLIANAVSNEGGGVPQQPRPLELEGAARDSSVDADANVAADPGVIVVDVPVHRRAHPTSDTQPNSTDGAR